ncbi:hypothetical protein M513_13570 [Trichuris suis]|uniref:Uncharacterized protein n=1 Tax=Trichuris suis TaxID=68888 RepID=A0A085LKQ8_9BILA|nr:hypothetical protein M513_13570 [Trichuris suis]
MFGRTSTNSSVMNELIPDEPSAIALLQAKGILHQQRPCDCGEGMSLSLNGRPARWRCQRARCRKQVSLRAGTCLEGKDADKIRACELRCEIHRYQAGIHQGGLVRTRLEP